MLSLKMVRGIENADGVRPVVHIPPDQARFVIGRDPACDWCIADKQLALSARHCEVVLIEGRHVLRDTSTNGTFLNGSPQRLPADHVLRHGDRIALGSYRVEVSVVPDAPSVTSKPAAASPAPVLRRGGDPAAMVGSDWERAVAHSGAPAADVKTGFTRISKPPPKEVVDQVLAAGPRVESPVATESPTPAREAVYRAPPGSQDILQRLAGGLNVPVEALGTTDPAVAAERVAKLLRRAVLALHKQLSDQAQQLNGMGSRAPLSIARSEAAPIRMAPGPDAAVATLLAARSDADAMIMMAVKELGQHSQRLLAAFAAANVRLADQLAPAAMERTVGGSDDPARLWKYYSTVWTALGTGVGKPWSEGFGATAAAYLAAAYDEKLADATAADKSTRP